MDDTVGSLVFVVVLRGHMPQVMKDLFLHFNIPNSPTEQQRFVSTNKVASLFVKTETNYIRRSVL